MHSLTNRRHREKSGDRDIFNEKPTREEQTFVAPTNQSTGPLGTRAVIHTTKGDIHLDLFPDLVPKTVENFVGLVKKGYYDEVIFHRVIPKFVSRSFVPLLLLLPSIEQFEVSRDRIRTLII